MKPLSQVLYEAYCYASDGVSAVTGEQLPKWSECTPYVKHCWKMTAQAAIIYLEAKKCLDNDQSTDVHSSLSQG